MKKKSLSVQTKRWIAFFMTFLMLSGNIFDLGLHAFAAETASTVIEVDAQAVREAYADGQVKSEEEVLASLPSFQAETEEQAEAMNQALAEALLEQLSGSDGSWLEVVDVKTLEGNDSIRILVAVRLAVLDEEAEDAQPEVVGIEVFTINTSSGEEKVEVRLVGEEVQDTNKDTFSVEAKEVEEEKPVESVPAEKPGESTSSEVTDGSTLSEETNESTPGEVTDGSTTGEETDESTPGEVTDGSTPSEETDESNSGEVTDGSTPSEETDESTSGEVTDGSTPSEETNESSSDEESTTPLEQDGDKGQEAAETSSDETTDSEESTEPAEEGVLVASIDGRIVLSALVENELENSEDTSVPETETSEDEKEPAAPGNETSEDEKEPAAPGNETSEDEKEPAAPGSETGEDEKEPAAPGSETGEDEKEPAAPGDETGEDEKEPATPGNETGKDEEEKETSVIGSAEKVESENLGATGEVKLDIAPFTFSKVGFSLMPAAPLAQGDGELLVTVVDQYGVPVAGAQVKVEYRFEDVGSNSILNNDGTGSQILTTNENGEAKLDYTTLTVDYRDGIKWKQKTIDTQGYKGTFTLSQVSSPEGYEALRGDLLQFNKGKGSYALSKSYDNESAQIIKDGAQPQVKLINRKAENSVKIRALAIGQAGLEFTFYITVDGIPYNGTIANEGGQTLEVKNGEVTIPQDDNNGTHTYTLGGLGVGQDVVIRETGKSRCKLVRLLHNSTLLDLGDVSFTSQKDDNGIYTFVNAKFGEGSASGAQLELTKKAIRNDEASQYGDIVYDMELTVAGKGKVSEFETPVNVLFIVDRSSSMRDYVDGNGYGNAGNQSRWNITRRSMNTMAKNLIQANPQSQVAAVYYSDDEGGVISSWTSQVGYEWITMGNPTTNKGTYAYYGFEEGLEQLSILRNQQHNYNPTYVVFMTDGDESDGSYGVQRAINKAKEINQLYPDVQIHTLGISKDPGTDVLNPQGENRYQDSYTKATTETDISNTFTGILNMIFENYEVPVVTDVVSGNVEYINGTAKTWVNDTEVTGEAEYNRGSKTFTWTINKKDGDKAILDGMENVHRLTYQVRVTNDSTNYTNLADSDTGTHSDDYGWYSNGIAELRCRNVYTESFPKPVVQTESIINNQDIDILKVDAENDQPLNGAVFGVYNQSGTEVFTLTTGSDGKANLNFAQDLAAQFGARPQAGDTRIFTIAEKTAPDGYAKIDGTIATFTVEYTGRMFRIAKVDKKDNFVVNNSQVASYNENNGVLTVENSIGAREVPVTITKNFASGDASVLENLSYTVNIKGGSVDENVTLNSSNRFTATQQISLEPGVTYTVTEVPGEKYELAGNIVISANGNTYNNSFTFAENMTSISIALTNQATRGSIRFVKQDEKGAVLPGATFGVYTDALCQTEAVATAVSGQDGVSFANLPVGAYYVKEISAPAHYEVSDAIYSVVVTKGNTATVGTGTVTNDYVNDGSITVVKKLAEGTSETFANGAQFQFTASKGGVTYTGTAVFDSAEDVANGVTVEWQVNGETVTSLTGLEYGSWTVSETQADSKFELVSAAGDGANVTVSSKVATVVLGVEDTNAQVTFTNRASTNAGKINLSKAIAVANPTYQGAFPVAVYEKNSEDQMIMVLGSLKNLNANGTKQEVSGLKLDHTYYVREAEVAGYTLSGVTVNGQAASPVQWNGNSYYPVPLTDGNAVEVVVTNTASTYSGKNIQVTKVLEENFLLADGQSEDFVFVLTGPNGYRDEKTVTVTKNGGTITSTTATFTAPAAGWAAGSYTITEAEEDSYNLVGFTSSVSGLDVVEGRAFTLTDSIFSSNSSILFTATNRVKTVTLDRDDVTLEKVIDKGIWMIPTEGKTFQYTLTTPDRTISGITATVTKDGVSTSNISEKLLDNYGVDYQLRLPVGSYTLTELSDNQFNPVSMAATGATVTASTASSVTFTVTKDTQKVDLVSTNTVKGSDLGSKITVVKQIPNANVGTTQDRTFQFTLTAPDGTTVTGTAAVGQNATTANVVWNGDLSNMPYGSYTIREEANNKFDFSGAQASGMSASVNANVVTFQFNGEGSMTATYTNTPKASGSVTVEKYIAAGSKANAGDSFTFDVYKDGVKVDGKSVTITASNEISAQTETLAGSAVVTGLIPGEEYEIREQVPNGYRLDSLAVVGEDDAVFTMPMNEAVTVKAVNSNEKGAGVGTLTKVFETNGLAVEDVTFRLYKDAEEDVLIATGTMAANTFAGTGVNKTSTTVVWDADVSTLEVGSYYITEELSAQSNYQLKSINGDSNAQTTAVAEFTVSGNGSAANITFTNEPKSHAGEGNVVVSKVLDNGYELAATVDDTFTISVKNASNTEVFRQTVAANQFTQDSATYSWNAIDLPNGIYTVTETISGSNFEQVMSTSTTSFTITTADSNEEVVVHNQVKSVDKNTFDLNVIKKVNSENIVDGNRDFTFTLTGPGIAEPITMTASNATKDGVEAAYTLPDSFKWQYGTYTITEAEDDLYTLASVTGTNGTSGNVSARTFSFTLDASLAQTGTLTVTFVNNQNVAADGAVTLSKAMKDGESFISAMDTFIFKVSESKETIDSGNVITVKGDGTAVSVTGLKLGATYYIKETQMGENYRLEGFTGLTDAGDGVYSFTVPVNASTENVFAITATNRIAENGTLTVTKTVNGYDQLPQSMKNDSFTFQVKKADGTIVKDGDNETFTLKHGESKQFTNLAMGQYTVTEILGENSNYAVVGQETVSVTLGHNNGNTKDVTVTMYNAIRKDGMITVSKVLSFGTANDDLFSMELVEYVDDVEISSTTKTVKAGESVTFEGLSLGSTYKVREVSREGYILKGVTTTIGQVVNNEAILTLDGEHAAATVTVTNHQIQKEINLPIYKYSRYSSNPLEGAGFTLYSYAEDGRGNPVVGNLIQGEQLTGEDGRLTITGLRTGRYILKETKVPSRHYTPNYVIAFEVVERDGILSILMINSNDNFSYENGVLNIRNQRRSGGGGGGGDDDDEIDINDGDVPLGELPEITIEDPDVPLAGLPDAGGFPVESLALVGAGMMLAGWMLGKKKEDDEEK